MSFSNIMVHLDLEHTDGAYLRIAIDLAGRFNAKLIGIAAATGQSSHYEDETITQMPLRELYSDITKRLAQAEDRFRSMANSRRIEWRSAIARPADYISREARAADLVVIGAQRNGLVSDLAGSLDPGDLVMQVGRPILVVPPQIEALKLKLAMVCWKDTREARRAVSDALPLSTRFRKLSSSKSFRMSPVAMQHTVELTTSYLGWSAMASGLPLEFSIAPNERIPWKSYFSMAQILLWRVLMATCDCVNGCLVVLPTIFFTVRLYAR